jgi:hypothetical protein
MPLLPSLDLCNKKCDCVFWFLNDPKSNFCGYGKKPRWNTPDTGWNLQNPTVITTVLHNGEYLGQYANTADTCQIDENSKGFHNSKEYILKYSRRFV